MSTSTISKKITSIAIGGFDGMHIGHQKLFEALDTHGAILAIETGYANMTYGKKREKYTHLPVYIYQLSDIKHLDDKAFVQKLTEDFPSLKKIVVGYDFCFGKNRAYSIDDLRRDFSGVVEVISEVTYNGLSVHSHVIRSLLGRADLALCRQLLGRDYSVEGKVIKGQGIGAKSLVPTLNINTSSLLPKEGVYATFTRLNSKEAFHPSVTFLGHRLSTDGKMALETHLLEDGLVIAERAEIVFIAYIRENRKFENLPSLKEAIVMDIEKSRKILKSRSL